MRPLRLTLEGFRSYADRADFELVDRTLVGVVGPTGAGKSSILDGISFALYGRTASMPGNATKPLIHRWDPVRGTAPGVAKVELWFSVGHTTYRVVRTIKAKGPGGQVLERWDAVDGTKLETIADKAREIADAVEGLTGLDFNAFMRSVLLAQNQFQELLAAAPADAARVLTGLFGFGVIADMRSITKERLTRAEAELAAAAKASTALDEMREQQARATDAVEASTRRERELTGIVDELAEIERRLADAAREHATAGDLADRLEAAIGRLPAADEVEATMADAAGHRQLLEAARDASVSAREALASADRELDAALAAGTPDTLASLGTAIAEHEAQVVEAGKAERERTDAEQVLMSARDAAEVADGAVAAATANEASAVEAAGRAAADLRAIEAAHAAHVLAAGLEPGSPCPVCARTVEEVPDPGEVDGLEDAREAAVLATERAEAASIARQRAEHERVGAISRRDAAEERLRAAVERLTATEDARDAAAAVVAELVEVVGGDPSDPPQALAAARESFAALGSAKRSAAEALARADAAVDALEGTEVEASVAALWEAHLAAAAVVGADPGHWDTVGEAEAAMNAIRRALDEALVEQGRLVLTAAAAVEAARAGRATLFDGVGLGPDADHADALRSAAESRAGAAARLEVLSEQVASGERALAEAEQTAALALRLERFHADLAPGRFPQYLIDEKRHELAVAGSDWFRRLSAGRYEFTLAENRFKVRELTAAGIVRDAETLSGGETFLASLSLALGLASIVGLEQGTAQAFFIDEGFGSLDAEALDLAMEGVERLVSEEGDRLVLVVSHVPEMRARIEDLIVLNKDPVTGATSVIRG